MSKLLFAAGCLILCIVGFRRPPTATNFSVQKLAPGVWACIQNDKGGHAISNAGIVDLGNETLVFDAFINPDAAAELKQTAEKLTGHPVSFVVNSHFHDDHIRGDQAFTPGASIISSEWTKNEMKKVEPEERDWARTHIHESIQRAKQRLIAASPNEKDEDIMWLAYYEAIAQSLPKLKMVLPNITFTDSLWIHGSTRSVLLRECKNGHTGSDVVMVLPKEKVAFLGDLLFVQRHPWLGDGDADSWKKHLENFYADTSLKQFVPGHGPVAGKDAIQALVYYINDLEQLTKQAIQNGESDSMFVKTAILPKYENWWYGRFYSGNLEFLYGQMKK